MPTIYTTDFNIVCATLGGFTVLFGLVSYLLKEHFYLSEACESKIFCVVSSSSRLSLDGELNPSSQ